MKEQNQCNESDLTGFDRDLAQLTLKVEKQTFTREDIVTFLAQYQNVSPVLTRHLREKLATSPCSSDEFMRRINQG